MTHELKIQKQWADAKLAGEKPFEIRRNDRGFQKGDIVRYKVIDPKTGEPWVEPGFPRVVSNENGVGKKYESGRHPLEFRDFLITYVIEGQEGLERGYCVFADAPVLKNVGRLDDPEKEFYLNAAKQIANLPPVCVPAFEHAKSGSNFICSHLDTDGFHCKLKRGECGSQEKLKNGNGQPASEAPEA